MRARKKGKICHDLIISGSAGEKQKKKIFFVLFCFVSRIKVRNVKRGRERKKGSCREGRGKENVKRIETRKNSRNLRLFDALSITS